MRELLIATGNQGKFIEISDALSGINFKLISLKDLGLDGDLVIESGRTFGENAYKKAKHYHHLTGLLTLAEDSGILVEALNGELGVQTRRWGAGEKASDEEWIENFMKRMDGEQNRNAHFVCWACLLDKGLEQFFRGETFGKIAEELKAPILPGIPLSSCFIPQGFREPYASLTVAEKNKVSHRGKAMAQVRSFLDDLADIV